ncbi:hypothetical protein JCM10212_003926 [Sporobolomyces blumeae]
MATFSKATFDAAKYAAARPHYPRELYAHVLEYAAVPKRSQTRTALLDLGCGPGLSTLPFAPHFDRVVGVDPSTNMVRAANAILTEKRRHGEIDERCDVEFKQAKADQLEDVVEDESVDLVVAGQAAHWFDPVPTYRSIARALKPGGAFVFWGYGEIFFPDRPELSELIPPYSGGLLGPYWDQPGRSIVEDLLRPFPLPIASSLSRADPRPPSRDDPSRAFDPRHFKRTFHLRDDPSSSKMTPLMVQEQAEAGSVSIERHGLLLTKPLTLDLLSAYLSTWSSLHKYLDEVQRDPPRSSSSSSSSSSTSTRLAEGPVETLIREMNERGWNKGEEVVGAWEMGFVMGKKKH